jgi:hypothetical protein
MKPQFNPIWGFLRLLEEKQLPEQKGLNTRDQVSVKRISLYLRQGEM